MGVACIGRWGGFAALAVLLGACSKAPEPAAAPEPPQRATPTAKAALPAVTDHAGIAWRKAATDPEVDAAFAEARAQSKPVFLYWGADWCPPCNQVKATLFNRQDFIERARAFVPVYIDGDRPGAQKIGARFKVSGYPTMVLFRPDGTELTRLPGEVEPERYLEVVTLGINAQRPVREVLAGARTGAGALAPSDWRLLAFYSWETDDQQLVPRREVPALLKQLAAACPPHETAAATRLWLKALAAADDAPASAPDPAAAPRLLQLLGDDPSARAHFDVLASSAAEITRAASARGSPERTRVRDAYDRTLARFQADPTLSRADRIGALVGRVDLARIDIAKGAGDAASGPKATLPPLAPALLADIREQVARADREITDGYERQAVITTAAYLLAHADLFDEADALLLGNLAKSHSPYYLMTGLAENAAERGDTKTALRWHREAFEKSEGPATRLQWGARYLGALVRFAPQDEAEIGKVAGQLLDEAAAQPNVFYERSARSLRRVSTQLRDWNRGDLHAAAWRRFDAQLRALCARIDAGDGQRATCDALTKPEAKKDA
jgi:thiol-disulfide isomerase/thioredoxin